jgi:hypothetical protein
MAKKNNQQKFVGRANELEAFEKLLKGKGTDNQSQVFYVSEAGGIGKTRLLQEMSKIAQTADFLDSSQFLRVFLCHSSGDKSSVRGIYKKLSLYQLDIWLDEKRLLPGQDWNLEITKAVRASDVVLVCLSHRSISKAGYVQKEIKYALDLADEQPEGAIFIIPVKLDDCEIPERLRRWQWVEISVDGGFEKLIQSLKHRAKTLGLSMELH